MQSMCYAPGYQGGRRDGVKFHHSEISELQMLLDTFIPRLQRRQSERVNEE